MSDNQSPGKEKETPTDERETELAKPNADTSDAAWSEEIMEWAIASSTCGGLPHKEDETADKAADEKDDKPACP